MAYASLPKLVPIDASNTCPTNVVKPSLSEVLQSDPVKRLFSQPNLVIKTVPLNILSESNKDFFGSKKNGMNVTLLNNVRQPEISIVPLRMIEEEKEEDANLLPSKIEDKKSEIALVPIEKKVCGHYEPCENIVCDVTVQQYVDQDGMSPMLATSIEEGEINAPVAKHCQNELCDALSIDHNRCRRALIKLYRCDKSRMCDICGTTLKGRKNFYRIHHRNCKPKDEYRHNNVDRVHLQRERMRERELQILESAKTKRNDYSDPTRAMEILRKNDELIIIPKTMPNQQPIITITSIPTTSIGGSNQPNAQVNDANARGSNLAPIGNISVLSRNSAVPDSAVRLDDGKAQPIGQMRFPSLQQNSFVTCTVTTVPAPTSAASLPAVSSQNQYIRLAAPAQVTSSMNSTSTTTSTSSSTTTATTTVQSLTINNWVVSPSHVLTTTPIQPKSFLTPIRVVPIANLITAPSLLHRMQGVPKFCIMADNVLKPVTMSNLPIQPAQPASRVTAGAVTASANASAAQQKVIKVPIEHNPQKRRAIKKTPKKKSFFCIYCSKYFSTDWYFKMHVAKHEQKAFSRNFSDKSFSNKFDVKKDIINQHSNPDFACDKCNYVCKSAVSFSNHVKIHAATLCTDEANQLNKLNGEETNCITTVHDSNGECIETEHVDPLGNASEDMRVHINGEATRDDVGSLGSRQHEDEEPSAINGSNSENPNGCNFVSVKDEPKNFQEEVAVMSR